MTGDALPFAELDVSLPFHPSDALVSRRIPRVYAAGISPRAKISSVNARFAVAMSVYAVLALLGWVLLTGKIRDALWILLAGLAVKTAIVKAQRRDE